MRAELLMPLYKQWDVTHYIFDVIVLTLVKKNASGILHLPMKKKVKQLGM